jgi:hypothetical protein
MKDIFFQVTCIISIIFIVAVTGCVAPPKEDIKPSIKPTTENGGNPMPNSVSPSPTSVNLVTAATAYQTQPAPTVGYITWAPTTAIPEDQVCLIYLSSFDWKYAVNNSAQSFVLKNPPLYINYTITKPFNVTGTHVIFKNKENPLDETRIIYSYYNPYSYLDVTVRNKTTGVVYAQDGFSKNYGYNLNKTIRVTQPGDLLIEFKGYNVTSTVGIWVKPIGNLNDTLDISKLECQSQDYVKKLNQ